MDTVVDPSTPYHASQPAFSRAITNTERVVAGGWWWVGSGLNSNTFAINFVRLEVSFISTTADDGEPQAGRPGTGLDWMVWLLWGSVNCGWMV